MSREFIRYFWAAILILVERNLEKLQNTKIGRTKTSNFIVWLVIYLTDSTMRRSIVTRVYGNIVFLYILLSGSCYISSAPSAFFYITMESSVFNPAVNAILAKFGEKNTHPWSAEIYYGYPVYNTIRDIYGSSR